jgi:gas vesicle protein
MSRNGNHVVSGIGWLLFGGAIGAGIALLYAPKTGRDTRRMITRRAERGKLYMVDAGKDILDRGREIYEQGRKIADEAQEILDKGRKLVNG